MRARKGGNGENRGDDCAENFTSLNPPRREEDGREDLAEVGLEMRGELVALSDRKSVV